MCDVLSAVGLVAIIILLSSSVTFLGLFLNEKINKPLVGDVFSWCGAGERSDMDEDDDPWVALAKITEVCSDGSVRIEGWYMNRNGKSWKADGHYGAGWPCYKKKLLSGTTVEAACKSTANVSQPVP